MQIYEILILAVALAMDACAVAMTNGMTNPKLPPHRALLIGGFFGFFQFLMPLIGFFVTGIVANAFLATFEKISAWVSFGLLVFLGGKMLFDCILELHKNKTAPDTEPSSCPCAQLTIGKLTSQAIATSIDALAVGVTLQMASISSQGLALGVWGATLLIGGITFLLSVGAVYIGKVLGNKLADKAGIFGGIVLVAIGVKILIESFL
ncbi:MAG: hypothetical protein E7368_01365 [Clostridiales bacterium]|nr:hypothetical protein [Clostridiales bacterium]